MPTVLPLPKYHQIYLVLREQLHEGEFAAGLPPEMVLSREFGAGRVTVRRALAQLASEGLIVREPGRGTRPAPPGAQRRSANGQHGHRQAGKGGLTGLLENIVSMSLRTSVKVLDVATIAASKAVA
ncbi:MAG: GntR family transcriptional regulator, partial [Burkholderiaceae bacterium]